MLHYKSVFRESSISVFNISVLSCKILYSNIYDFALNRN